MEELEYTLPRLFRALGIESNVEKCLNTTECCTKTVQEAQGRPFYVDAPSIKALPVCVGGGSKRLPRWFGALI